MEYKLVRTEGQNDSVVIDALETQVNSLIAQGWRPLGGVSISTVFRGDGTAIFVYYAQAMTREI